MWENAAFLAGRFAKQLQDCVVEQVCLHVQRGLVSGLPKLAVAVSFAGYILAAQCCWQLTNVNKSPVVLDPLHRTALRVLFLFLLCYLWCLSTYLTGTSQRSVHLTCNKYKCEQDDQQHLSLAYLQGANTIPYP